MNCLNSILLEGDIVSAPEPISRLIGVEYVSFEMRSKRFYRSGEELDRETIDVAVIATGRLAKACLENLPIGRGIRVVGRLSTINSKLGIFAEHVEFKPVKKEVKDK